jgi:hypothetical protein
LEKFGDDWRRRYLSGIPNDGNNTSIDEEADEENSAPKLRLVEVGGILHDIIALLKRARASFIY